jgi:hypothetical protein
MLASSKVSIAAIFIGPSCAVFIDKKHGNGKLFKGPAKFDEWRRGREAGTAYHCVSPDDQRGNRHAAVIRDNEIHYEVAASLDKDFIVIEGATHGITPCVRCEASRQQV